MRNNFTRKERAKKLGLIYCEKCGYCNKKNNVKTFGTCTCCNYVLDPKAKFNFEMKIKLKGEKVHY